MLKIEERYAIIKDVCTIIEKFPFLEEYFKEVIDRMNNYGTITEQMISDYNEKKNRTELIFSFRNYYYKTHNIGEIQNILKNNNID